MTISVNTNSAAMIALENLNATQNNLNTAQNQISTGLSVNNAQDNASVWAIAQGQRAEVSAMGAVQSSLNRATSIADVAMTAGTAISDLLNQLKAKIVSALDPSQDANSRTLLNNDYQALLQQITNTADNAAFDGSNILDGSLSNNIQFLANADGTSVITLSVQNMSLGGSLVTLPANSDILTVTNATAMLAAVNTSITSTNAALGDLGSQANEIQAQNTFASKLTDVLQTGIGNLVDADMAKESASLQALQVQQQLGAQSLSIANQTPDVILSLFKSG
ncbi:MAG TPA: flagellin [Caulobacteraceae bacterium]|jgi:flagellin|nr:flagellin [Caulobacteraceae bacterium]